MVTERSKRTAQAARELYEAKLRAQLEPVHAGKFLCIEPVSGQYFLGETFDEAVNAALDACPDHLTHTLRIAERAALHLGVMIQ